MIRIRRLVLGLVLAVLVSSRVKAFSWAPSEVPQPRASTSLVRRMTPVSVHVMGVGVSEHLTASVGLLTAASEDTTANFNGEL